MEIIQSNQCCEIVKPTVNSESINNKDIQTYKTIPQDNNKDVDCNKGDSSDSGSFGLKKIREFKFIDTKDVKQVNSFKLGAGESFSPTKPDEKDIPSGESLKDVIENEVRLWKLEKDLFRDLDLPSISFEEGSGDQDSNKPVSLTLSEEDILKKTSDVKKLIEDLYSSMMDDRWIENVIGVSDKSNETNLINDHVASLLAKEFASIEVKKSEENILCILRDYERSQIEAKDTEFRGSLDKTVDYTEIDNMKWHTVPRRDAERPKGRKYYKPLMKAIIIKHRINKIMRRRAWLFILKVITFGCVSKQL